MNRISTLPLIQYFVRHKTYGRYGQNSLIYPVS